MLGLFVGYCYELDYSLMVAIGVLVVDIMIVFMMISVIIFWSITLDIMLPLDY